MKCGICVRYDCNNGCDFKVLKTFSILCWSDVGDLLFLKFFLARIYVRIRKDHKGSFGD